MQLCFPFTGRKWVCRYPSPTGRNPRPPEIQQLKGPRRKAQQLTLNIDYKQLEERTLMGRGYRDEDDKNEDNRSEELGIDVGEGECLKVAASGKAILVRFADSGEEKWIPVSQICEDSEVYKEGTEGVLVVTEWFADKEKLQ